MVNFNKSTVLTQIVTIFPFHPVNMRLLQFYRCCFVNEHKLTSASCHQSQKNINQFHDLKQCHLLENAESKKLIYSLKEKKAEKDFTVKKKTISFYYRCFEYCISEL